MPRNAFEIQHSMHGPVEIVPFLESVASGAVESDREPAVRQPCRQKNQTVSVPGVWVHLTKRAAIS